MYPLMKLPAFVEVVEGRPELVELLLGDALAVSGKDLVLNLVDRPKHKQLIILLSIHMQEA